MNFMKGFIEITITDGATERKVLVNTAHIISTSGNKVFLANGRSYYLAKESYEEIKSLISKAQERSIWRR